ncbi:MAG: hypothetical protein KDJ24_19290, partial [Gammaproteobacteria bacterium]|nr:hypothetical protein [Gammaproteobacteria bacterium]
MKRIYRSVRRTVGAGLRRLGLRRPEEPAHKPEFDARALARRLGVAESALAGDAHEGSLAYAGARRARELFGPRFFVDLDRIAELSAAFAAEHPDIVSRLDALADHDVDGGLAVYTVTTTRLGAQYNWSSPPVGLAEDLLYPVRPHRFAFAPRHAWACLRRPALTSHLQGMLASWIAYAESGDCQYCYVSNLVVLQRVFATMWAWAFLASRPQDASTEGLGLEWLLLQVLYADARFLATRLGDSVPNNHLLADRFAHWFLATVLPELLDPTP